MVGDYRLERKIKEDPITRTWEASQISVQRPVMLEMLSTAASQDAALVKTFLANVRAKALVTHPGIGSVYEAVAGDEAIFFSRERLEGRNLRELAAEGRQFRPLEVVTLLEQIAAAIIYLEEQEVATSEFELNHFVMVGPERIRLMNLAVAGQKEVDLTARSKILLGELFGRSVPEGLPGTTRVKSLCAFMADPHRPVPLTWQQIGTLARQVLDQLEANRPSAAAPPPAPAAQTRPPLVNPPAIWALLGGVALIGVVIFMLVSSREEKAAPVLPPVTRFPAEITIAAGSYPLAGGGSVEVRQPFLIERGEVSVSDYGEFLKEPSHEDFEHPDQPASKKDHLPDDWDALWRAAVKQDDWRGRPMSLGCPVVGVDWWDAYAFAKWRGGRLPSLNQWTAAASMEGAPEKTSLWGKAGDSEEDVTGAGVVGMAGNVREWTREREIDPANPLAPKSYVAAGASFREPAGGIETRLWLGSRSARRDDLGFRVIRRK